MERAERIRRIARELGYRPNAAARAIRSGRFGTVAMLLSAEPVHSLLPQGLLHGVQSALAERNLRLEIARLSDEELTDEQQMPRLLRELSADGVLIDYTSRIPPQMIQIIHDSHIPAIWINSRQGEDCVYPDDREAAERAARHLIDLGHTRIAYLDCWHGPDHVAPHYSVIERQAGYEQAMAAAGLSPHVVRPDKSELPSAQWTQFAERMLAAPDRPTAVLTYAGKQVVAVYCACLRLGLSVPGDVSLVNFSESTFSHVGLAVTTMLMPHEREGAEAVEMLMRKIDDPLSALPARAMPFGFEPGGSTGPAT